MESLYVIKIGGNIIDDRERLESFLKAFSSINSNKILVHGGGKLATQFAEQLGIKQKMIDGRRITDAESLKIITMVYAGFINKNIVASLQANDCNAIGLTGADGDAMLAHKRKHPLIDYGFVGDIDSVNTDLLSGLLRMNLSPVIAPITHNQQGQLLNTNADTIAQEIAKSMAANYSVALVYTFEKPGVLLDTEDEASVIPIINREKYSRLRSENRIFAGMIPKLDNAFSAIESGVEKVVIGRAEDLGQLTTGKKGTAIVNE